MSGVLADLRDWLAPGAAQKVRGVEAMLLVRGVKRVCNLWGMQALLLSSDLPVFLFCWVLNLKLLVETFFEIMLLFLFYSKR